jgi:hypothetical protein
MVFQPAANRYTDYPKADGGTSWNNIVKWTTAEFICVIVQRGFAHSVLGIQRFTSSF